MQLKAREVAASGCCRKLHRGGTLVTRGGQLHIRRVATGDSASGSSNAPQAGSKDALDARPLFLRSGATWRSLARLATAQRPLTAAPQVVRPAPSRSPAVDIGLDAASRQSSSVTDASTSNANTGLASWWAGLPSRYKVVLAGSMSFVICNMVSSGERDVDRQGTCQALHRQGGGHGGT
jgi:hypothetical protein